MSGVIDYYWQRAQEAWDRGDINEYWAWIEKHDDAVRSISKDEA